MWKLIELSQAVLQYSQQKICCEFACNGSDTDTTLRAVTANTVKKVPTLLNRKQLAAELPASVAQVYRAVEDGLIVPDFLDFKGSGLFKFQRLSAIRRTLAKPDIT